VYRRISYLAMMYWHFAKDLKKWALSVAHPGARLEGRTEFAGSGLRNHPKFINGVSELIKELPIQAERDQSYAVFILCLTVNHVFEREV
jgi:hypothetical protein